MRLGFVVITFALLIAASVVANIVRKKIIARQEARLAGWEDMTTEQKLEVLREMKDVQIRDGARRWATGIVAGTAFVWFMPAALYQIADVADDTRNIVDRQEVVSEETTLQACQIRNAGERANRQGTLGDIAATSRFLLRINIDQEDVDGLAADRMAAIPDVTATDRDCDQDGEIGDEGDYPPDQ